MTLEGVANIWMNICCCDKHLLMNFHLSEGSSSHGMKVLAMPQKRYGTA